MTPSETADRICGSVADLVTLVKHPWAFETDADRERALSVAADLLTTANAILGHGGAA